MKKLYRSENNRYTLRLLDEMMRPLPLEGVTVNVRLITPMGETAFKASNTDMSFNGSEVSFIIPAYVSRTLSEGMHVIEGEAVNEAKRISSTFREFVTIEQPSKNKAELYDAYNGRIDLDALSSSVSSINVTAAFPAAYPYTLYMAINRIPAPMRKAGLIVIFCNSHGDWEEWQYKLTNISNELWSVTANWEDQKAFRGVINIDAHYPKESGKHTIQTAIESIPEHHKTTGCMISFSSVSGQQTWLYTGTDVSDFQNKERWVEVITSEDYTFKSI